MKLLTIRHGRAENADEFARTGVSDDLRPLTADGVARMRLGAAGLHRVVGDIHLLASSSLVRARQTADIVAAEFGGLAITELQALRSEAAPTDLADWLRDAGAKETIAVVGHESHLTDLVGWLLIGDRTDIVEIKKGAAVMLETDGVNWSKGSARLLWALAPRQMRSLAEPITPTDSC